MNFRPDTRIEADHVIEVSEETLDAVNIADDDHLRKGDEEVRPAGGVVSTIPVYGRGVFFGDKMGSLFFSIFGRLKQ